MKHNDGSRTGSLRTVDLGRVEFACPPFCQLTTNSWLPYHLRKSPPLLNGNHSAVLRCARQELDRETMPPEATSHQSGRSGHYLASQAPRGKWRSPSGRPVRRPATRHRQTSMQWDPGIFQMPSGDRERSCHFGSPSAEARRRLCLLSPLGLQPSEGKRPYSLIGPPARRRRSSKQLHHQLNRMRVHR